MSFVELTPEAIRSVKKFLEERGVQAPIRIDIQSSGCCDPSLGLFLDHRRPADLVEESDGLQFVISPDIHKTVGEVTITWVDERDKKGFVITSRKPLSEWEGFGVCDIRIADKG
jgi:Fe-S cluster assembly iron-binding protein IscA